MTLANRQWAVMPALVLMLGLAGAAHAAVSGPEFELWGSGGSPYLIDSTRGFSGGYNPIAGSADLAVNRNTGTIYGIDTASYGVEFARMDPSQYYLKVIAPADAGVGTTRVYTNNYHYAGSVAGGNDLGNSKISMGGTYDPYLMTNGNAGVYVGAGSGGAPTWREYVVQSSAEGLGVTNEGSVGTPVDTAARVTSTTLQDGIGSFGDAGHWNGLEMDVHKGQFVPINDTASGSLEDPNGLVSRYFFGVSTSGGSGHYFESVYVVHADATRSVEPDATNVGTRKAYLRDRNGNQARLLDGTAFANLVPGVGDVGEDMAVNPANGDLYILSSTGSNGFAYLSAIRPTIPDDSDAALSFEVIDLDLSDNGGLPGGNTHLELSTIYDDLVAAMGLAFNLDGTRLHLAVVPTTVDGNEVNAVYGLDVVAVPEPATLGLLAIGGAAIASARRRRRR
jgi:hypothetical protein